MYNNGQAQDENLANLQRILTEIYSKGPQNDGPSLAETRAKRDRNMKYGEAAGSVMPVVGGPLGQIYGAQHDAHVEGAGQGLTTASEIAPLALGSYTMGGSLLAPAAMKAWKEKIWSKADPGLRKTFRDMDPSRGVKKLAKNFGISW